MSKNHCSVLFCGAIIASLLGGCAPTVDSGDAPSVASKQPVVSEPSEKGCGDPDQGVGECVPGSFEGGETCVDLGGSDKDPIAGVYGQATTACEALGLILNKLAVDAVDCAPGSGKAQYVCCPTPPPPPEPAVDSCQDDKVGFDGCVDLATLEAAASARCADTGHVLASTSPLAGCPDGQASVAVISCCPATP
jgi:hypothetical protein